MYFSISFFILSILFNGPLYADSSVAKGNSNSGKWSVALTADQGTVDFLAIGRPSALKIRGKGKGAVGNFIVDGVNASGEVRFQVQTFDTGIETRTRHMNEKYLEVGKYPEARLLLTKLVLPELIAHGDGKADFIPFEGNLSLHGMEKPVTGQLALERKKGIVSADAVFTLKIADYGIAKPGYAGITMADNVDVTVKFTAPLNTDQVSTGKK